MLASPTNWHTNQGTILWLAAFKMFFSHCLWPEQTGDSFLGHRLRATDLWDTETRRDGWIRHAFEPPLRDKLFHDETYLPSYSLSISVSYFIFREWQSNHKQDSPLSVNSHPSFTLPVVHTCPVLCTHVIGFSAGPFAHVNYNNRPCGWCARRFRWVLDGNYL